MKVNTLIENTRMQGRSDLRNEWGLSLHIAHDNKNILFDMGTSGAFVENAARLGCPIESVDAAVVSHHHFDHGGGLGAFLSANQKARAYLCGNTKDCYVQVFGFLKKYVGLNKQLFTRYADRIEFINKPAEVFPRVFLINEIQRVYPLPRGDRFLFVKSDGHFMLDDFAHELLMVIREDDGVTLFTGCSHNGILNMIETAMKRFPGVPIKSIFGGFHLIDLPIPLIASSTMGGSASEVQDVGKQILTYGVGEVYTCHCTGAKAHRVVLPVMGDHLRHFPTGSHAEV